MSDILTTRPKHKQHEKPLLVYEVYEANGSLLYITSASFEAVNELEDGDYIVKRVWTPDPNSTPEERKP